MLHLRHKSSSVAEDPEKQKLDQIKSLSESIQKTTQSIVEQIQGIEDAAEEGNDDETKSIVIADASEHSFSPRKDRERSRGDSTPHSSPGKAMIDILSREVPEEGKDEIPIRLA